MSKDVQWYRMQLRECLPLSEQMNDGEVVAALRQIAGDRGSTATLIIFAGAALLAYGDPQYAADALRALILSPSAGHQKPARYFIGLFKALLPIPEQMSAWENPDEVLGWLLNNRANLHWDERNHRFALGVAHSNPVIVAHRGLWWPNLVENSRAAFERAVAAGFPAECDVWPSADGQPVVIHDETLDRTTVGQGRVSSYTAEQLKTIHLRDPEPDSCLPLLSEVPNLVGYVEVKAPDSPDFVRRVIEIMGPRGWLLQSFDERTLEYARGFNPQLRVAYLVDDPSGFELALRRGWSVHADHLILNQATVLRFRESNLRIGAWTVNEEADIRRVIGWELDVIISDEPALVSQLVAEARPGPATNRDNSAT